MKRRRVLVCGATGFIGRNLLERFASRPELDVVAIRHTTAPPRGRLPKGRARWVKADLTRPEDVRRVLKGVDVVLQAAATTSGSKDIVERPYHHVTDNAVMNSHLFRAAHEAGVGHFIFFSCGVMYPVQETPAKESDFRHEITPKYFGVGWTKVYLEKMCAFYAGLGKTRFAAIRHSNIYGPHDKYDLERSHVFGATVAKVMTATGGHITVWGDGSEERDLLYVDDLVDFVERLVEKQTAPFELINVGLGRSVSVAELVRRIVALSGRQLELRFDRSKPTIPFKLALDIERARSIYGWTPATSLDEGIRKSLAFYRDHYGKKGIIR